MSNNIFCLAVGKFDDKSIIAEFIPNSYMKPQVISNQIHKEISLLLSEKPEVEWTISQESQFGLWSLIAYNNICYMFLGSRSYPSHLVNSLLFDIKSALKDTSHSNSEVLEIISKKYQDPKGIDKVRNLTSQVKQVQELAYVGIQKVMNNSETSERLAFKTESLASNSFLLHNESKKLEKQMYLRKMKLKICVGIVITAIFIYLLWSFSSGE